jgi:small subunit ribosomal protein S16
MSPFPASTNPLICVESALFFGRLGRHFRPGATGNQGFNDMVTIRLTRRGATNTPFYHVVVTDSRKRQGGKSLEQVGFFNPKAVKNETKLRLDLARIDYWVSKGAQQSDRVKNLVTTFRKANA